MDLVTPTSLSCTIVLGYLCLVRALRWQRYNAIHNQYQAKYKNKTLTPAEAQKVMHASACYDMPWLVNYGTAFALFKTYAIPSISKLLLATKELGSKENITKRYADTELLISTWVGCPLSNIPSEKTGATVPMGEVDPRGAIALARVNWLHSHYNISNGDYLYTMALFVLEPAAWTSRYGWRAFSPLECHAYYVFWSEIGRRMGIKDIPESFEALKAWAQAYEGEYMVPADSNKIVAEHTLDELLAALPKAFGLKKFGDRIGTCLLEERVRIAMSKEAQPWYMHAITLGCLQTFAFIERWLLLPRKSPWWPVSIPLSKITPDGRQYPTKWQSRPYYKAESKGLGYYVDVLFVKLGLYKEMPGPQLKSQGYRYEEMGPTRLENKGHQEVMQMAEKLQGCPITGVWSLKTEKE